MSMHVLPKANSYPPDSAAVDLDTKIRCRQFAYRSPQEFVRILDRVRMRESVAQRAPDFAIVRVPGERLGIMQSPRSDR
jgi:hypothetical protein